MSTPIKKLMTLRPPSLAQSWTIVTFVLNKDLNLQEDNPLYGYLLPFGSYSSKSEADEEVRRLIKVSGYKEFFVLDYAQIQPLRDRETHAAPVFVDQQGQLLRWEKARHEQDARAHEQSLALRKMVAAEAREEIDPQTLAYFKRQCYLAVNHHAEYRAHLHSAQQAWEEYRACRELIQAHHRKYPEHEPAWLPYLQQTLIARGEETLYTNVAQAYAVLRSDLLGLDNKSEEEEFKYS